MTRLTTVRHRRPIHRRGICEGEVAAITTGHATEIFARCAPTASGTNRNGCRVQSQVIYDSLPCLLEQAGAGMAHVVVEKVFFRNLHADHDDFRQVRLEAYRRRGITAERLPAMTCVQQAPCRLGRDVELQAYAVLPATGGRARVTSSSSGSDQFHVKLIEVGPARHLYVGNVAGHEGNGRPASDFRRQSDRMFRQAAEALRSHGSSFLDVVRTWIYLDDIDRDYAELNASRNAFYAQEGLRRLPASTGIGGGLHPAGTRCTLDLYALLNPDVARIEVMHTATLNEAFEYGSAFSRGMKMALPEQTYLFISGTASVDEQGATVHPNDVRAQIERMLVNVEGLLQPHHAAWGDVCQAVTFLKSPAYLEPFQHSCARRGLLEAPHTIVQAEICRPELLCEMEAIAVVPNAG